MTDETDYKYQSRTCKHMDEFMRYLNQSPVKIRTRMGSHEWWICNLCEIHNDYS